MKKIILALALASSLMIIVTGCGGGSDDSTIDIDDVTLEFKTSATYDLRDYMSPEQDQTHNYVDKTYINNNGEKIYNAIPDKESYSTTRFEINGAIIKEYDDAELDVTSTILSDRIVEALETIENMEIVTVRFADQDDYVNKIITTLTLTTEEVSFDMQMKLVCKVNNYLASKEVNNNTYNDVLEITCTTTSTSSETVSGMPFNFISNGYGRFYLAKGVGMISETSEYCSITTLDTTISKECKKEISEITTINN